MQYESMFEKLAKLNKLNEKKETLLTQLKGGSNQDRASSLSYLN
jgi:hypothetical protein